MCCSIFFLFLHNFISLRIHQSGRCKNVVKSPNPCSCSIKQPVWKTVKRSNQWTWTWGDFTAHKYGWAYYWQKFLWICVSWPCPVTQNVLTLTADRQCTQLSCTMPESSNDWHSCKIFYRTTTDIIYILSYLENLWICQPGTTVQFSPAAIQSVFPVNHKPFIISAYINTDYLLKFVNANKKITIINSPVM